MTPENAKRIARLRRLILKTGWQHPFFLLPSQRIRFRIDPATKTASVSTRGVVRWNPDFLDAMSDQKVAGVICHEIMHPLMGHFGRRGSRDPKRWNRSADRAINWILRSAGIDLPDGALYPSPGQESMIAEELYDLEPEVEDNSEELGPGEGCGPEEGEGEGGEGEDQEGDPPSDREWREIAKQAEAVAKSRAGGSAFAKICEAPPARVRWRDVLRGAAARAVSSHGFDDVSFRKLHRRSDEFLLPGPTAYKALVAVAIDTSGSVPDAALETALSEVVAISKVSLDVRFYLVTHDSVVQWSGWIQAGKRGSATIRGALKGRGGTLFDPAYRAIEAAGCRFDAMVHLTDGEPCDGEWPSKPRNVRKPVCALIGHYNKQNVPASWRAIEVERLV